MVTPARGEIWLVRFFPSEGDEIQKTRPAVVMTVPGVGKMRLHIVVPLTGWQPQFMQYSWMVRLVPDAANNLTKESAADAFQVKSVSSGRFESKIGQLGARQVQSVAAAIALCVGYLRS